MLIVALVFPLVSGCKGLAPRPYDIKDYALADKMLGLTREDYRTLPLVGEKGGGTDASAVDTKIAKGPVEPPIPDLAPILAAPPVPKIGQTKLVTIAVTDDVPLKDVLLELSREADVDMEVDANIEGGITFRATQRPFNEIIERISEFAGLRYSMKNGVLRVEKDTPYVEIYTLDFLNVDRQSTNSVSLSTSVLSSSTGGGSSGGGSSSSSSSGGGSSGGGGLTTGSSTSITSSTNSDFWLKFEDGVKQIIAYSPAMRSSEYSEPQSQLSPDAAAAAAGVAAAAPAATAAKTGGAAGGAGAPAPTTGTDAKGGATTGSSQYTINRQAGSLTVLATERQHRLIKEFIKRLEYSASAQVLIEAKILEVTLNDQYQSGIDWNKFGGTALSGAANFGGISPGSGSASFDFKKNTITGLNIDLDLAVSLMQEFGITRTLSSPRLHAMNNQQAVLTFARNEVYFTVSVEKQNVTTTGTADTTYSISSTINTVPIGIIMSLLPSINRETGEITLSVRPTLSRVVDRVVDPGLTLAKALNDLDVDVENRIPVVEVRELDSILKLKSGQVMVIGGLMEDKNINNESGIPGAQEVPVLGHLFKGEDRERSTSELVIFIRATMIGQDGGVEKPDKDLYDRYTRDPRPLSFE